MLRAFLILVALDVAASFYAGPALVRPQLFHANPALRSEAIRAPSPVASAKIIPAVDLAIGGALLKNAAAASGTTKIVLGATGLLSILNLAVTDNARYAGAKRAYAKVVGIPKGEMGLAKKWYDAVRIQVFGQFIGLIMLVKGSLLGAGVFMAANVAFFLLGAAAAKHDGDGLPAPIKPGIAKFVLITDMVLALSAFAAALATGLLQTISACLFAAGCMIGAVEGTPKTFAAVKKILAPVGLALSLFVPGLYI